MADSEHQTAWDIAESIGVCFLGTGPSQYPMSAIVRQDEDAIYFLTDVDSQKIAEIGDGKSVQITFGDKGANRFLFIEGHAVVSDDREKISELWSAFAKAWWDSADNPAIRLITVTPARAEYWDGPNRLAAASKMLFAAMTGGRPDMGENRKTTM